MAQSATAPANVNDNPVNDNGHQKSISNNIASSVVMVTAAAATASSSAALINASPSPIASSTTITESPTIKTSTEYLNGGGSGTGSVSGSNGAGGGCGSSISSGGSGHENNVISLEEDGGAFGKITIDENNKHQQIDKGNANDILFNNGGGASSELMMLCRQVQLNTSNGIRDGNRHEDTNSKDSCTSITEIGKCTVFNVSSLGLPVATHCTYTFHQQIQN